jgi:DNA modification methylase
MIKPYYTDDRITLYCGDCLEVMKQIESGSIDAVVTDPPYGTELLAGGYGRRQLHDKGDGKGRCIDNDKDLSSLYAVYPELTRSIESGWIAAFFAARKMPNFIDVTSRDDWFGEIIWDKCAPGLGFHIRYAHESIGIFKIGKPARPEKPLLSVIRQAVTHTELHPHIKPVKVIASLVHWTSSINDIVLDPFMGSGTTGVACIKTNRRFIGIEIDETYAKIALDRILEAKSQPMLGLTDQAESTPKESGLVQCGLWHGTHNTEQ